MKKQALLTGTGYSPAQIAKLENAGYVVVQRPVVGPDELRELLANVSAYVLGGDERLGADELDRAERLEVISFVGTGFEAFVDQQAATARGIPIANTPNSATAAVAEHTVGLILGLGRRLFEQNERAKRGTTPFQPSREIGQTQIGIVGMGRIAARMARILRQGFGCDVLYANRTRKPSLEAELGLEYATLDELFRRVQMAVLLVAYSPEANHMVDEGLLAGARDGLILVNSASAHLVNPAALRTALVSGKVEAAAFDGYWIEPLPAPADDPYGLLALPDAKFVVTPHTAAKTQGTWKRMTDTAIDNVLNLTNRSRA